MKHNATKYLVVLAILLLAGFTQEAFAQAGKLSGTIKDANTNQPLPGATVLLQGTTTGAATDADGHYVVIGIAPGTYSVQISSVGYTTQVIQNVIISGVRTTTLDVSLSQEVIQGQEVTVQATRPLVDPNQTSSQTVITGQQISSLPVTSVQDVIATTGNSYKGFVRGSRRYETKTVVDGIDISDDYYGTALGNYGGQLYHNTNRFHEAQNSSIFNLNPSAVGMASLHTGAGSSAYPSATGGVVDISLADMHGPIHGSVSYRISPSTARPGPDSLDFYNDAALYAQIKQSLEDAGSPKAAYYTWTPGEYSAGDKPTQDLRISLGGSVMKNWNFMVSGRLFSDHGYEPNNFSKRMSGILKTTYSFSKNTKLEAIGMIEDKGLWGGWANTSYNDFWRFYLQGVAQNRGGSYAGSLKLTHFFSPKSVLSVQAYRTFNKMAYGYPDDNGDGITEINEHGKFINFEDPAVIKKYIGDADVRNKMFYTMLSDQTTNSGIVKPGLGNQYKLKNPLPYAEQHSSYSNVIKINYANQLFTNHYIQAGASFDAQTYAKHLIYGVDGINSTLNGMLEPYIPHKWKRHPWNLALYASDRMEYAGLIINLGMRLAFVDRDMRQIKDYFHPFVRDSVTINGRKLARNNFDRGKKIPVDVFWEPSLGVSHPISSTASMYFSYNRSEQLVPYSVLYRYYDGNSSLDRFFTYQDPAQKPIISNNYELGVQWEFTHGWGLDVNAYMRSIQNYSRASMSATSRLLPGQEFLVSSGAINSFETSFGYADVRGLELVLRREPIQIAKDVSLGLTASYTYSSIEASVETGQNQNSFVDETNKPGQLPFGNVKYFEYFPERITGGTSTLTGGYDRTHRVVLRALATFPASFTLGLIGNFESGFLYPRAVGVDPRDRSLLVAPANYQIDARLEKKFNLTETVGLDVYIDVTNLTNKENIVAYQNNTPQGPINFQLHDNPGSRLILNDGTAIYGPARNIFFGAKVRF